MSEPKVLDRVPDGWKVIGGATNHPYGLRWICNGESRFSLEYETALVPEEVAIEWWRDNT